MHHPAVYCGSRSGYTPGRTIPTNGFPVPLFSASRTNKKLPHSVLSLYIVVMLQARIMVKERVNGKFTDHQKMQYHLENNFMGLLCYSMNCSFFRKVLRGSWKWIKIIVVGSNPFSALLTKFDFYLILMDSTQNDLNFRNPDSKFHSFNFLHASNPHFDFFILYGGHKRRFCPFSDKRNILDSK